MRRFAPPLIGLTALLLYLVLMPTPRQILQAQISGLGVNFQATDPALTTCTNPAPLVYDFSNGKLFGCNNGTTAQINASGGSGTVTSIATTAPITGGTITGTGTIACATCATTTNGGALSATAPVTISAGGVIACSTCSTAAALASAALTSATTISNTETQVVGLTIPAGTFIVGSTFRLSLAGTYTTGATPGVATFNFRIGHTAGSGNTPFIGGSNLIATQTNQPFWVDATVTVRTLTSSGSAAGTGIVCITSAGTTNTFTLTTSDSPVTINSTVSNVVELTYVSTQAGTSFKFVTAQINQVL